MSRTRIKMLERIVIATLGLAASPMLLAQGVVTLDFGVDTQDDVRRIRVGPDGRILVEVLTDETPGNLFCGVYGLDNQGSMLSPFGSNGRLSLENNCTRGMLVRADGSFLLAQNQQINFRSATSVLTGTVDLPAEFSPSGAVRDIVFAEQPDGKLLVGGTRGECASPSCESWVLSRFNADGTLDTSFSGGTVVMDITSGSDVLTSVHALPSNKILVSGKTGVGAPPSATTITRLNSDGQIDATFGANGSVQMPLNTGETQIDSLGRIYVQGSPMQRLSADGTLDAGYSVTVSGSPHIKNFVVDASDRVVMFGVKGSPLVGAVTAGYVARFDTSGNADTSFNGTGSRDLTFDTAMAGECFGDVDGNQPVIACPVFQMADPGIPARSNLALERLTESGVADAAFGVNQPPFDSYPDAYSFAPVSAPYGTTGVMSAAVTITGTTVPVSITINSPDTGSGYSIGCNGTFTYLPGVIEAGQEVCIRMNAPNQPGSSKWATLLVGGRAGTFVVNTTNSPADSVPDAFSFTDQTGVAVSTAITSNVITVQGITGFSTVTVQNGAYSLGCDPQGFTSESTTVANGATICVRHTSSASASTETSTTLTVSGVSDVFTSTTAAATTTPPPSNPPSSSGGSGGGGSMNLASLAMLTLLGALSRRYGRHLRR